MAYLSLAATSAVPSQCLSRVDVRSSLKKDMQFGSTGQLLKSLHMKSLQLILTDIFEAMQPRMRPMPESVLNQIINATATIIAGGHMLPPP